MKKLPYIFSFLGLWLGGNALAQSLQYNQVPEFLNANAYWAYYNHIGLDWSSGKPVYDSNALSSWHPFRNANVGKNGYQPADETGAVSVSDPHTGKLLFYTNGGSIWYPDHKVMSNGDTLRFGSLTASEWKNRLPSDGTSAQGTCVVPVPGDASKYYVFTIEPHVNIRLKSHQLHYSVVDMTLAGGKGAVVDAMKNLPVLYKNRPNTQPKNGAIDFVYSMVAIPGNNCDIWLLTYAWKHNERSVSIYPKDDFINAANGPDMLYYAFHITENGIDTVPVVSTSGMHKLAIDASHMMFTVSPDRSHVLFSSRMPMFQGVDPLVMGVNAAIKIPMHTSELSRFDPGTGKIYDPIPFDFQAKRGAFNAQAVMTDFFNIGSAAFASNNRNLYIVSANYFASETYLYQLDISKRDSAAIAQSRFAVDSLINPPTAACYEVSPITLRTYKDTIFAIWGFQPKIGSINQPDLQGAACDFQWDYFTLPLDKPNGGCFVNEVVYAMNNIENTLVAELNTCEEQLLQPRISNAKAYYKWNDGATTETIKVQQPGTYWVIYSLLEGNCIQLYTDTFRITAEGFEVLVNVNIDTLGTVEPFEKYQWLYEDEVIPGATGRYHVALQNGNYRVIATNEAGCRDTSAIYRITNLTHIRAVAGIAVTVYPNPATDMIYIQSAASLSFRLMDMSGRVILDRIKGASVDISTVTAGMYQLVAYDERDIALGYWKIVKQ